MPRHDGNTLNQARNGVVERDTLSRVPAHDAEVLLSRSRQVDGQQWPELVIGWCGDRVDVTWKTAAVMTTSASSTPSRSSGWPRDL